MHCNQRLSALGTLVCLILPATYLVAQAQSETINVGVLAPLSGMRADAGTYIKNALTLAQSEIHNDPGRKYKLQFIFEDTQYQPALAVSAFHKLKNVDRVNYLIGTQGSSETLAIAPLAERARIILITPTAQSDDISEAGDYIFRLIHNTRNEAPFFAPFVAKKMKSNTLHFLALQTAISPSYRKYFSPVFTSTGKRIGLWQEFAATESEFRPYLLRLIKEAPTDIFILALPKQTGLILQQAAALGIKAQFYGIGIESPEYLSVGRKAAEGLLYPYSYDPNSGDEKPRIFHSLYKKTFGEEPDAGAANSYDAAYLLSHCLEQFGDISDLVKSCLYKVKNYHGASGRFSIDQNGDAIKELFVKTIRNGKFLRYED